MVVYRAINRIRTALDRSPTTVRRVSRYDLVLAIIPVSFAVAGLLGTTLSMDWTSAITGAAALSGLAVVDALFLNPTRGPATGGPPV